MSKIARVKFIRDKEPNIKALTAENKVLDGALYIATDTGTMWMGTSATSLIQIKDNINTNTTYTLTKSGNTITLKGSDGSSVNVTDSNTIYNNATASAAGLMSAADKSKLDSVATGANKTVVDASFVANSTNPVQSNVVKSALDGKSDIGHKHVKADITDFPTSMPASDVSAWAKAATKPSYSKAEVGLGNVDNTADANKSVKYATSAGSASTATTVVNGGAASADVARHVWFSDSSNETARVSDDNFKYNPSGNLLTTNISGNAATASSVTWGNVSGKPSAFTPASHTHDDRYYTESEINTKLNAKANSSHTHTKSQITDFPTSMPASDVYSWAKQSSKPSYTISEVSGNLPASRISGVINAANLPSYVDDVIEGYLNGGKFYTTKSSSGAYSGEITAEAGKIYVDLSNNKTYRWSGSAYVVISETIALGETSSTAYRGDRGATAYNHAAAKGSAFANGLYKITTNAQGHVTAATAVQKSDITALGIPAQDTNTWNALRGATASAAGTAGYVDAPAKGQQGYFLRGDATWAAISKGTVGLGNVDNTADSTKSVKYASSAGSASKCNNVIYTHQNEINFSGGKQPTCYFNYRNADSDASDGGTTGITYKFCNYTSNTAYSTIEANNFKGNLTGKATSAGSADTATKATSADSATRASTADRAIEIADYNNTNQGIKIGYAGDGFTSADFKYALGMNDERKIKDVSKEEYRKWLGLGSAAYTSSGAYASASHTHTKSQITDFPTSMPASDVYSWAKASSKPSYSWSEISNKPSIPSVGNGTITITQNGATKGTFTLNQSDNATIALTDNNTVYSLPAATASTLGGVKVGSNITNSSGTISLTKANVTAALGYTPPTSDTNTWRPEEVIISSTQPSANTCKLWIKI